MPNEWSLICKLGCGNYPSLQNVKHVRWNSNLIVAKNLATKGYEKVIQWYVFYSKEQELKCCNSSVVVVGPIDSLAIEKFILDNDIGNYESLNLN